MQHRYAVLALLGLILSSIAEARWPHEAIISDTTATTGVEVVRFLHLNNSGGNSADQRDQVVWGDFNGDGHDDLALSLMHVYFPSQPEYDSQIAIYFGGSTLPQEPYSLQQAGVFETSEETCRVVHVDPDVRRWTQQALAAGDINRDGYDDLVLTLDGGSYYRSGILVLYGREDLPGSVINLADESLEGITWIESQQIVQKLDCRDMNNDGWPDIAVLVDAGYSNQMFSLVSGATIREPTDMLLWSSGPLRVILPVGSLEFPSADFALGDYNGDGRSDVFLMTYGFSETTHLRKLVLGRDDWFGHDHLYFDELDTVGDVVEIQVAGRLIDYGRAAVAMGDFDADGFDDLAHYNHHTRDLPEYTFGEVGIIFGMSTVSSPLVLGAEPTAGEFRLVNEYDPVRPPLDIGSLHFTDLDGDGREDLLADRWSFSWGPEYVYLFYGDSGLEGATMDIQIPHRFQFVGPPLSQPHGLRSVAGGGDLNSDGVPDLAVMEPSRTDYRGGRQGDGITYVFLGQEVAESTPKTRAVIAGNAPPVDFGPVVRAVIDHATGTFSRDHLTIHRSAPVHATGAALPVRWELKTARHPMNATLTFHYTDRELGPREESLLTVFLWPEGETGWFALPSTVDARRNEITVTGVVGPGQFAVAEGPFLAPGNSDLNRDGRVGVTDLFILATEWHEMLTGQ